MVPLPLQINKITKVKGPLTVWNFKNDNNDRQIRRAFQLIYGRIIACSTNFIFVFSLPTLKIDIKLKINKSFLVSNHDLIEIDKGIIIVTNLLIKLIKLKNKEAKII